MADGCGGESARASVAQPTDATRITPIATRRRIDRKSDTRGPPRRRCCEAPDVRRRKRLPIALAAIGAVLIAALVVSQFALPGYTEHRIENRLTDRGGSATVNVEALPAARLLFDHGDRIEVRGTGLDLELDEERPRILEKLDGFDDVEVTLDDTRAGPIEVRRFELTRSGSAPYDVVAQGRTTPGDLASYGATRLGLPVGPLLDYVTGRVPQTARPIPVRLDMRIRSENGRAIVVSGGGTVAGFPTGPLAELITEAIVVRL